jgi:tRNA threonylcarbamoyl adenosine modification protein (Sua5/YciO/YrdC/YwlC family)
MIEYVIAENPDDRILERASKELHNGKLICFPTDTNWIIAASPYSKKGVDALYKLKGEGRGKHFSVICRNISKASEFANISNYCYKILNKVVPGPYTFIFEPVGHLPKPIKSYKKEKQIGVRIPRSKLVNCFVEIHGEPIVTSSLTAEMLLELPNSTYMEGQEEIYSYQIEEGYSNILSMIIDPGELSFLGASSIIDFSDGDVPNILRAGAGDVTPFGG